eukprot:gene162-774_t
MGGGKKQNQRTKGNLKPSSSSRAAEVLLQEGRTGFIGFGGLSEATGNAFGYVPKAIGTETESEHEIDSDLRMLMRKMTKKDTTTRLKAVQEFTKLCADKNPDCVSRILSFWPKIYNKLAEDFDHRVREAIQQAHLEVVGKVGRSLAPQLKLLIACWLKSHFDQYPPAAVLAKRSFELSFSGDKKRDALSFCKKELISNIQDNLIKQTQDTISDPKVIPVEERESKYNRLISATLFSFGYLLDSLSPSDIESLSSELESILKEKKFWKFSKQKSPMIRNAFFTAVSFLSQNCKCIFKEYSSVACPTVLLCLDESDPTVVRSLWESCLHIVNDIEDCWERVNARKAVLPKLWSILRAGGHGNATIIFPNILPFLSKIPSMVFGKGAGFFQEFFRNFRNGLLSEKALASSSESIAIMSAFMECLHYVMLDDRFKGEVQGSDTEETVSQYLINEEICYFVQTCLGEKNLFWKEVFLQNLSKLISYLERQDGINECRLYEKGLVERIYILLEKTCLNSLTLDGVENQTTAKQLLLNLEGLLKIVMFKINVSSKRGKRNITFAMPDGNDTLAPVGLASNVDLNSERGQCNIGEKMTESSKDLLLKISTSCVELLLTEKRLVYLTFLCNISSYVKEKTMFTELINCIMETRLRITGEIVKEAAIDEDIQSLGSRFLKDFISQLIEEEATSDASFWNSLDCQEAVIRVLCSMLLFIDGERKIRFLNMLNEFCSRPVLHCLLVERVLASLDTDSVTDWFSTGVCWDRLISYVSRCLLPGNAHNNQDGNGDSHIWKCIQQCLFYDAGKVPLLDSKKTEELFTIFKNYLASFDVDHGTKNCLRILVIMTEFYKKQLQNEKIPALTAELLLVTFQTTIRIDDDGVATQGGEMLYNGLCLLRKSSPLSEGMGEFLQRIAYWLKKTTTETSDSKRLSKVCDCTVALVKHLNEDRTSEKLPDKVKEFVNQLLEGSRSLDVHKKGLHLLPSVLSGVCNISCLHGEQNSVIQNDELRRALNSAAYGVNLLLKLDLVPEDSNAMKYKTILNAVQLCVYGDQDVVEGRFCDSENLEITLSSIIELEKDIKTLMQAEMFDKQHLLMLSLERAFENGGGVDILAFDRLCKMVSDISQSDLPSNELLACAMSRGCNDLNSADVLKVVLRHLNDLSMIRAMVEQFLDELSDVSSENVEDFSRCLDLCMTSLICWQQNLQKTKEESHDFAQVVGTIVTHLIGWKDNAQDALLFVSDLSEAELLHLDVNMKIMRLLCFVLVTAPESLDGSQWDFLLCSLASWIQTCEGNISILTQDPCKMIFGFDAFNLCAFTGLAFERMIGANALAGNMIKPELGMKFIAQLNSEWTGKNQATISDELLSEWQEFFAPAIYKGVYTFYTELLDAVSKSTQPGHVLRRTDNRRGVTTLHLLQSLTCALDSIPAMVFIDIIVCKESVEQQLASGAQQPVAMQDNSFDQNQIKLIQETVESLSMQLASEYHCVQTMALSLLYKMIDHIHATITTMTDESTEGDECDLVRSFPYKMHSVLETSQEVLINHLDDELIKLGSYLQEAHAERFAKHLLSYMFSWLCVLRMFRGAEADQRAAHANFFRKRGLVGPLLRILFSLLPYEIGSQLGRDEFQVKGGNLSFHTLRQCAFRVYLSALECIPAVIRSWCNNNMDRKSSSIIERFTCSYVSPILCSREIEQVSNTSKTFTNMAIKTRPAAREVVALYTVEEISMELVVKMSHSHPLGHVVVECGKRVGVSNAQWRQWMLQLTMYLTQQNGTIVDGLSLWKRNVDKKFEGVEECMICFSVVHGTNYQLPTITCRVCKKKFHSACLIKKAQQKISMVLESKGIDFSVVDVAASAEDKAKMREVADDEKALPPQIASGDQYCGKRNFSALSMGGPLNFWDQMYRGETSRAETSQLFFKHLSFGLASFHLAVFASCVVFGWEENDNVHYTNSWAVHLENGDTEVANKIAKRHGFVNLGQVGSLPGYYHFVHKQTHKRRKRREVDKTELLLTEKEVKWVEQQQVLERDKRSIVPDFVGISHPSAITIQDPLFKDQWYLSLICSLSHHFFCEFDSTKTNCLDYTHPDLVRNYDSKASYDFNDYDNDPMPRSSDPSNCHGTKCAGQVAAESGNGVCGVGVAFNSSIGGIRMLDGNTTDTIEGSSLSFRNNYIHIYSCAWGPKDDGKRFGRPGTLASKALELGTKELTWRDVQTVIVETALMTSPLDEGWRRNGAGKWFNQKFGFGRMDASQLVEKAKSWDNIAKQKKCWDNKNAGSWKIPESGTVLVSSNATACSDTDSEVRTLEHVQLVMSLKHRHRGHLSIELISPSGTRSQILKTRRNDHSNKGLKDWIFMSVHFWGEDPRGMWTLAVTDNNNNNRQHYRAKMKHGDVEDATEALQDELIGKPRPQDEDLESGSQEHEGVVDKNKEKVDSKLSEDFEGGVFEDGTYRDTRKGRTKKLARNGKSKQRDGKKGKTWKKKKTNKRKKKNHKFHHQQKHKQRSHKKDRPTVAVKEFTFVPTLFGKPLDELAGKAPASTTTRPQQANNMNQNQQDLSSGPEPNWNQSQPKLNEMQLKPFESASGTINSPPGPQGPQGPQGAVMSQNQPGVMQPTTRQRFGHEKTTPTSATSQHDLIQGLVKSVLAEMFAALRSQRNDTRNIGVAGQAINAMGGNNGAAVASKQPTENVSSSLSKAWRNEKGVQKINTLLSILEKARNVSGKLNASDSRDYNNNNNNTTRGDEMVSDVLKVLRDILSAGKVDDKVNDFKSRVSKLVEDSSNETRYLTQKLFDDLEPGGRANRTTVVINDALSLISAIFERDSQKKKADFGGQSQEVGIVLRRPDGSFVIPNPLSTGLQIETSPGSFTKSWGNGSQIETVRIEHTKVSPVNIVNLGAKESGNKTVGLNDADMGGSRKEDRGIDNGITKKIEDAGSANDENNIELEVERSGEDEDEENGEDDEADEVIHQSENRRTDAESVRDGLLNMRGLKHGLENGLRSRKHYHKYGSVHHNFMGINQDGNEIDPGYKRIHADSEDLNEGVGEKSLGSSKPDRDSSKHNRDSSKLNPDSKPKYDNIDVTVVFDNDKKGVEFLKEVRKGDATKKRKPSPAILQDLEEFTVKKPAKKKHSQKKKHSSHHMNTPTTFYLPAEDEDNNEPTGSDNNDDDASRSKGEIPESEADDNDESENTESSSTNMYDVNALQNALPFYPIPVPDQRGYGLVTPFYEPYQDEELTQGIDMLNALEQESLVEDGRDYYEANDRKPWKRSLSEDYMAAKKRPSFGSLRPGLAKTRKRRSFQDAKNLPFHGRTTQPTPPRKLATVAEVSTAKRRFQDLVDFVHLNPPTMLDVLMHSYPRSEKNYISPHLPLRGKAANVKRRKRRSVKEDSNESSSLADNIRVHGVLSVQHRKRRSVDVDLEEGDTNASNRTVYRDKRDKILDDYDDDVGDDGENEPHVVKRSAIFTGDTRSSVGKRKISSLEDALRKKVLSMRTQSKSVMKLLQRVHDDISFGNVNDLRDLEAQVSALQKKKSDKGKRKERQSVNTKLKSKSITPKAKTNNNNDQNNNNDNNNDDDSVNDSDTQDKLAYKQNPDEYLKYGAGNTGTLESWTLVFHGT